MFRAFRYRKNKTERSGARANTTPPSVLARGASICMAFLITACATSPTGRSQFIAFSEQMLASQGAAAFAEMKTRTPASADTKTRRYVSCVANTLLETMGEKPSKWEVVVFADQQLNAFALPGRKIGIYEGILKAATNQHMLAAVIGHEIGHVQAHHGNERVSASAAGELAIKAIQVIGSGSGSQGSGLNPKVLSAIGIGIEYGILRPYSREHESEADRIGLDLMARAGFDPKQSVTLWRNMAKLSGGAPPEFLSTHPSSKTRIRDLRKAIPIVMPRYRAVRHKPNC
uniref:Peptidase family M48 n=1 Tax=Candidatus Kentrum sp. LPFa TaxID=2126335 RepID=A0A450WED0_9GAMM|nr:MAG: Peptidase family M48 [Candidatus Kentron sp. LPFa]VFK31356.1 MAG: Peptidase family M48 [Candidatus Kentron sp. LPFa]